MAMEIAGGKRLTKNLPARKSVHATEHPTQSVTAVTLPMKSARYEAPQHAAMPMDAAMTSCAQVCLGNRMNVECSLQNVV